MKNLKKMAALGMAAALGMTAGSTVFAETVTTQGGSTQPHNVTGNYVAGSSSDTVYSVDVQWGAMEFTYTAASQGQWNPTDHQYDSDGTTTGSWTCADGAGDITVTNHSNQKITATVSFTAASGFEGVAGSFTADTLTLENAAEKALGEPSNADSQTTTLSLSGEPETEFTDGAKVGEVKVTIADAQ